MLFNFGKKIEKEFNIFHVFKVTKKYKDPETIIKNHNVGNEVLPLQWNSKDLIISI